MPRAFPEIYSLTAAQHNSKSSNVVLLDCPPFSQNPGPSLGVTPSLRVLSAMDPDLQPSPWKYLPFELGESEDLENYEPGGFHPVHLSDVYDGRYKVVHKLGLGGFSTVWLARDTVTNRWVALKVIVARESPTYEARSTIASHPSIVGSRLFAVADGRFWIDGPNGRHLCLVFPVLGPNLAKLSKGIYSRIKPGLPRRYLFRLPKLLHIFIRTDFVMGVSWVAGSGWIVRVDANSVSTDFTVHNIALHLIDEFDSYNESDLIELFGHPQTAPVRTYSEKPPRPHAPDYIVIPLDFCSLTTTVLSRDICVIDFDQSFTIEDPPSDPLGIPAKYLAPEVAVGRFASSASDIWALGCAIFRIRSGDDLFFDYDTDCPETHSDRLSRLWVNYPRSGRKQNLMRTGLQLQRGSKASHFGPWKRRDH